MTGFGSGHVDLPRGKVLAEIRSVNQRYLDIRPRLSRELADLSLFAEQVVRERLRRGRVELQVHTEGTVLSPCVLDRQRARAALTAFSELRDELAPGAEVPLSLLAAVPDLFTEPTSFDHSALRDSVRLAIERAIDAMDAMCSREGQAIAEDFRGRCELLRVRVRETGAAVERSRDSSRRRLRERLSRLLSEVDPTLATARIDAEILLLAERCDVTEEITRLSSHLDQFAATLAQEGREPVGRRIDFLLQEMLREANTVGAKAQDAEISQLVIDIKVELERLREQVQNVE